MATLIIAEAGVNHNGEKTKALELIEAAAQSGADAVKFQTFNAEKLALFDAPKAAYQKKTSGASESQRAMLKALELPLDWHLEMQKYANDLGIQFISTAFDQGSLKFLETLNLPFYKIPSGEITNGPLMLTFAQTKKKLILSTGMATLGEIEQALAILAWGHNHEGIPESLEDVWRFWSSPDSANSLISNVSLLHCTSQYPTSMEEVNLRAMDTLSKSFGLPVGYSDHTQGLLMPAAAVARGATIIEKHFTLDRTLQGPDHMASLEPHELSQMVMEIRGIEKALGNGWKRPQISEWDTRSSARQKIIALTDIRKGDLYCLDNLTTARTGKGRSPIFIWDLFGTRAGRGYRAGEAVDDF